MTRIFHCFQCFCFYVHFVCWQNVELKAAGEESVCWRAVMRERVHWWFDCSGMSVLAQGTEDQKLCVLSPSSGSLRPGQTVCLEITSSLMWSEWVGIHYRPVPSGEHMSNYRLTYRVITKYFQNHMQSNFRDQAALGRGLLPCTYRVT